MRLRLTRTQRIKLFAGECPNIGGEGDCPVEHGDEVKLSAKVSLRVLQVRPRKGGGWSLHYELQDRRDPVRLLLRTPPVVVPDGDETPPTPDALARAAQESAYTGSPFAAIEDAGEAVDEKTQERFSEEAREGFRSQLERERREREARRLDERLRAVERLAAEKGIDISRKLTSIERRIESAEREVGRDAA